MVDLSDEEMAMLALVENVAREDLCDYEISRSIRRTEKEFPNRKRMAEALGISRSELYRYLSFGELPDFVVQDLGRAAAAARRHGRGERCVRTSRTKRGCAWHRKRPMVASGVWRSGSAEARQGDQTGLGRGRQAVAGVSDRNIDKIFAGGAHAGSITKDSVGLTVKIKAGMLTADKEKQIRELVARLFSDGEES